MSLPTLRRNVCVYLHSRAVSEQQADASFCLFLLEGLRLDPEDGGSTVLRNVDKFIQD
jgi:hypothetical protein